MEEVCELNEMQNLDGLKKLHDFYEDWQDLHKLHELDNVTLFVWVAFVEWDARVESSKSKCNSCVDDWREVRWTVGLVDDASIGEENKL